MSTFQGFPRPRGSVFAAALVLGSSLSPGFGQSIITNFAGSRFFFPADGIKAVDAPVGVVTAVAADADGNVYFADVTNDRVFKINSKGILTTAAGNGIDGYSGDGGPASKAAISDPGGLAFDHAGNLYICDRANFRIRKVDTSGTITTFAGNGRQGYFGDGGPAKKASLGRLTRIAIDNSNNVYLSDDQNHVVRRITTDGIIRTVAGDGRIGFGGDGGPAVHASLQFPSGLAVDVNDNVYVADRVGNRVRKVSARGIITTFAGSGVAGFSGDGGAATKAELRGPRGIAVGRDSSVYIADSTDNRIRRVEPSGKISTFAGNNIGGLQGDGGPISAASLDFPIDLSFAPDGTLLVADFNSLRVRAIAGGTIATIGGNGEFRYAGDGGPAGDALLPSPSGLAVDASGNVHLCDTFANRVRTINAFGIINLTAGTNIPGFAGDGGPATSASLSDCEGIAVDSSGNLYVADTANFRIRRITPSGITSTFAGNSLNKFAGDGSPAVSASLSLPQGVAVDSHGNVYIADTGNNRIRKVDTGGIISTIAGTGKAGYSGDHGPATAATLNDPARVTVDSKGNVYVSDNGNNVVRKISGGVITTVAGNGRFGFSGDKGPATSASLANPRGIAVDPEGVLYIAELDNNLVRRVTTDGIISIFAGTGTAVGPGNGRPPQLAGLNGPIDVAIDNSGNIYIATRTGARVRRVQPAPSSIVLSQVGITFRAAVDGASVAPRRIRVLNGGAGKISWSATARTLSGGNWLKLSPAQGSSTSNSTSSPILISVNPEGLAAGNYYGQIQVTSPGVANSPRFATIVLNVASASATNGPSVDPAGLVFTGDPGGPNPGPQTITISELHGKAITFTSTLVLGQGVPWLSVQPTKGTVAPNMPVNITFTPNLSGLAAQVYTATLKLVFSDGSKRDVPAVLTVGGGAPTSAGERTQASAATCTPTKLIPVSTELGSGFSVPAGWPVTIEASVVDDCGKPLTAGSVSAKFTNGDPAIALSSLQDGTWAATWNPRVVSGVTVTVSAQSSTGVLQGSAEITGALSQNAAVPIIAPGGLLNMASYAKQSPTAPGTLVSIFGSNLAAQSSSTSVLPLPTQLGNSSVILGGTLMPLMYAGGGQINAVVPFDLAVNTTQQLIVESAAALSVPEPVQILSSEPGTFTENGSGAGAAKVVGVNADGSQYTVSPSNPAHIGGMLMIYCTGVGDVQTSLEAGDPAPESPLAPTTDPVSVTVGGVQAKVLFAGLVPGFTGLYQVNAIVPNGAPTGDNVPLVLTADTQSSPVVTIAIH